MARQFATSIDLLRNELRNAVIQNLAGPPSTPASGQVYFDTGLNEFGYWTGSAWVYSTVTPDATTGAKGIVKLANDLGGTAALPTVTNLHLAGDTAINHKLTAVTDPSAAQDAATKNYVDAKLQGLSWKQPVTCATTAALPAYTWARGTAGADTLTANANGALTVDSYGVAAIDRVLVKDEANTSYGGIYTVTAAGDGTHPWKLTRASDAIGVGLIDAAVMVEFGSVNAGGLWTCSTPAGDLQAFNTAITGATTSGSGTISSVSAGDIATVASVLSVLWLWESPSGPLAQETGAGGSTINTSATYGATASGLTFYLYPAITFVMFQSATSVGTDGSYLTGNGTATIGPLTSAWADPTVPVTNGTSTRTAMSLARVIRFAMKGNGVATTLVGQSANRPIPFGLSWTVQGYADNAGAPGAPIELDWTITAPGGYFQVNVTFPVAPPAGTVYWIVATG